MGGQCGCEFHPFFLYSLSALDLMLLSVLQAVTLDAFEGVENNYELLLAIRNTNIDSLPEGFHKMFQNIVHFSLDIRDNKFESIAPAILYGNQTHWEHTGTKALQGGSVPPGNCLQLLRYPFL